MLMKGLLLIKNKSKSRSRENNTKTKKGKKKKNLKKPRTITITFPFAPKAYRRPQSNVLISERPFGTLSFCSFIISFLLLVPFFSVYSFRYTCCSTCHSLFFPFSFSSFCLSRFKSLSVGSCNKQSRMQKPANGLWGIRDRSGQRFRTKIASPVSSPFLHRSILWRARLGILRLPKTF